MKTNECPYVEEDENGSESLQFPRHFILEDSERKFVKNVEMHFSARMLGGQTLSSYDFNPLADAVKIEKVSSVYLQPPGKGKLLVEREKKASNRIMSFHNAARVATFSCESVSLSKPEQADPQR